MTGLERWLKAIGVTRRVVFRTLEVALVLVAASIITYTTLRLWPYEPLMVVPAEGAGTPNGEFIIQTDERTPGGLAVVREGDPILITFDSKNPGYDVTIRRNFLLYGRGLGPNGVVDFTPGDPASANYEGDLTQFFLTGSTEREGLTLPIEYPDRLIPGNVYREVTINEYSPNFVQNRTLETRTEQFLLLEPGDPVPKLSGE